MKQKITLYIRAGYAGLYLLSAEEQRVAAESQAIATDLGYHLHVWSATTGLLDTEKKTLRDCNDPLSALLAIHELPEKSLPVPAPQEGGLGGRAGQGQRHRLIQLDEGGVAQFGAGLGPAAWRDRWGGMVGRQLIKEVVQVALDGARGFLEDQEADDRKDQRGAPSEVGRAGAMARAEVGSVETPPRLFDEGDKIGRNGSRFVSHPDGVYRL